MTSKAGIPVDVGPRQQWLLLALLLTNGNRVVTTDRILEELWGDESEGKERALWVYIPRLRSCLGDAEVLITRDHGYSLSVDESKFDVRRFEAAAAEGRELIKDDPTAASERLSQGLELWPSWSSSGFEHVSPTLVLNHPRSRGHSGPAKGSDSRIRQLGVRTGGTPTPMPSKGDRGTSALPSMSSGQPQVSLVAYEEGKGVPERMAGRSRAGLPSRDR